MSIPLVTGAQNAITDSRVTASKILVRLKGETVAAPGMISL